MRIETDRLVIRPFAAHDLDGFRRLLDIPEVTGWQMKKGNAKGFLDWQISNYARMDIVHGIVCFGVFDRTSGDVLGAAGAGEHDDLHESELFYNLLPEARGHGYAREAAQAVTAWALVQYPIPYLIATVRTDNMASRKVVESCGYVFVDERRLKVHILGECFVFRYYRRYAPCSPHGGATGPVLM
jgi:RimJ/RimL family protein N-acetyltransferase